MAIPKKHVTADPAETSLDVDELEEEKTHDEMMGAGKTLEVNSLENQKHFEVICGPKLKICPHFDVQMEEKIRMEVEEWQNSIWVELQTAQMVAGCQTDEVAASVSSTVAVLVQRCAKTLWLYPWHPFGFAAL